MATTVTVNSNYAGEVAGKIFGASFKEADTLAQNCLTVLPDIALQVSVRKIAYADGRTDYTCGFTPNGAVTRSERVLAPKKIKNELEICKEDFRQVWTSATMGFSAHNDTMPKDESDALIAEMMASGAEKTDSHIWVGDAINDGEFDGFIKLFTADADVIKHGSGLTAPGAATDSSNVLATFATVSAAIPVALRRKSLKWMISPDVADAYTQALIANGAAAGFGGNANTELVYGRYALTVVNGLPDNTQVVWDPANAFFGTGLLNDHNSIRVKDMDESDLSGQVRYKEVFTAGVQYANSEDIVWFLSTAV